MGAGGRVSNPTAGVPAVGSSVLLFQVHLVACLQIQYDNNITDLKQLNLDIPYTLTKLEMHRTFQTNFN